MKLKDVIRVAIPFTGEPSFLQTEKELKDAYRKYVAIPFTGVPSFLRFNWSRFCGMLSWWQYPSRVNLHFYFYCCLWWCNCKRSGNTLHGWTFISTELSLEKKKINILWQYPSRVNLHFYIKSVLVNTVWEVVWQYPSRVNLHFYEILIQNHSFDKESGNTLHGWTFISTRRNQPKDCSFGMWQYPSRVNLHFYGILSRTA